MVLIIPLILFLGIIQIGFNLNKIQLIRFILIMVNPIVLQKSLARLIVIPNL